MVRKTFALERKREEQERQQAMPRDDIYMRRIAVEETRIAIAVKRAKEEAQDRIVALEELRASLLEKKSTIKLRSSAAQNVAYK